jgi:hypothetical protein
MTHLKDKPTGSRCILTAIVDGVDLQAIGYKYNKRRVLFFVAIVGAGSVHDGVPYKQRWADEHLNVATRDIPRPDLVSQYSSRSPKVDNHNQSKHHELMLEELWLTQDCWFRLYTTFFGIHVTDYWKLCRHHLHEYDPLACHGVVAFADRLAKVLAARGVRRNLYYTM